jgi:hypothetical protein
MLCASCGWATSTWASSATTCSRRSGMRTGEGLRLSSSSRSSRVV